MDIVTLIQSSQKLLYAFIAFGKNVIAFMTKPLGDHFADSSVLGWILKRIALPEGETYLFTSTPSLLDLGLTFIGVFMAYSLVKWAVGIVTGS